MEDFKYPINRDKDAYMYIHKEIFDNKSYTKYFDIEENSIVVDLGANIGLFTKFALQYNIQKIYSVEPELENFKCLVENNISYKVIPIFAALSKDGYVNIGKSDIAGIVTESEFGIKSFSFKSFIDFYNIQKIDFLKIDIEQAEFDLLNAEFFEYLKNNLIKKIVGEFHPNKNEKYFNDILYIYWNLKYIGYNVILTSIDRYDITNKILNNQILDNHKNAWDYYKQILFYANIDL
ncbi:MAG: FkbM family methyltransferase [Bacilli bacterium]